MKLTTLNEATRQQLINKGKAGAPEKIDGKTRYEKRVNSKISSTVKQYNSIDMNKAFKDNILTVDVKVRGETDDYEVKMSFGGFLDILHDQVEKNGKLDLRGIIKSLILGFNKDNVYISCTCPDFCLHGDTQIKLLNGEVLSIEEIYNRFISNNELWVYSVDDSGDFNPGKVTDVWISGVSKEFIKVTLDNGKEILTTPNHRYMMRDGSYKEAKDLIINEFLMSLDLNKIKVKNVEFITLDKEVPIYDLTVDKYENFYVDAGVILHNCYRMSYWATRNQIISGPKQTIPSPITNPNDKLGPGCKHVMLVLNNSSWIIKTASVFNNYINYIKDHYPKKYADIIYPAIYKKPYEEPVQMTIDDTDDLVTDTGELDIANKYGKERTQFKKGNVQGIRFSKENDDIDDDQILFDET